MKKMKRLIYTFYVSIGALLCGMTLMTLINEGDTFRATMIFILYMLMTYLIYIENGGDDCGRK